MQTNPIKEEKIGQFVGKVLFELSPTLPLEFGPVTFPGPRVIARELAFPRFLDESQAMIEFPKRPLPPPPEPKFETLPPPSPKPITSQRPVLERRGL